MADPEPPVEVLIATLREAEESAASLAAGQLADELLAVASIYQPESIRLLPLGSPGSTPEPHTSSDVGIGASGSDQAYLARAFHLGQRLRLAVTMELDVPPEDEDALYGRPGPDDTKHQPPDLQVSVTLPAGYPTTDAAPQLQLLNRFVGAHAVDPFLFGRVLRCFLHSPEAIKPSSDGPPVGLEWHREEPVLFEALEWAKDTVSAWYNEKEEELRVRSEQLDREREEKAAAAAAAGHAPGSFPVIPKPEPTAAHTKEELDALAARLGLQTSDTIVDRKSEFVAHACRLESADQVPLIVEWVLQDRRVLRAAHPAIFAYAVTLPDGTSHRDFDDDGETAAGGRLSHLLSILVRQPLLLPPTDFPLLWPHTLPTPSHCMGTEQVPHTEQRTCLTQSLNNVLVIVTRWWGGHLLGPDRFKHINRVARDALEKAGFVAPGGSAKK